MGDARNATNPVFAAQHSTINCLICLYRVFVECQSFPGRGPVEDRDELLAVEIGMLGLRRSASL